MAELHKMVNGANAREYSFANMLYEYLRVAHGRSKANVMRNTSMIAIAVMDGKLTAEEVLRGGDGLFLNGGDWYEMGGKKKYIKEDSFCRAIPGYHVSSWEAHTSIKRNCAYLTNDTITKAEFVRSMRRFCKTSEYKKYLKQKLQKEQLLEEQLLDEELAEKEAAESMGAASD